MGKRKRILVLLRRVRKLAHNAEHKVIARAAIGTHLTYYGLVTWEAHGTYRWAALAVGIIMIIEIVLPHSGGSE